MPDDAYLGLLPSGHISQVEKLDGAIPRYTILSHIWGSQEVAHKDVVEGSDRGKA